MRGNSHVRFLGEKGAVMPLTYPIYRSRVIFSWNPINPEFMTDISDAYEASYTIMLNLNKTWIEKQGDFFVESPIILLAAIIWYLKCAHKAV